MALPEIAFTAADTADSRAHPGCVVVFADLALDSEARRLDRATRGALSRAIGSEGWDGVKPGEGMTLAFPAGLEAAAVLLVKLPRRADTATLRKAGATIGRALKPAGALVLARAVRTLPPLVEGAALRAYAYARRAEAPKAPGTLTFAVADPDAAGAAAAEALSLAEAVHFTRDLVNDPANILTTTEFAARLESMRDLGLTVEVRQTDFASFLSAQDRRELQAFSAGWIMDYPDPEDILDIKFHSESSLNDTGYSNPEVDSLLEQARVEQNPDRRLGLYQDVERLLLDEASWLPLYFGVNHVVVKDNVKGWFEPPMVIPRLRYVTVER